MVQPIKKTHRLKSKFSGLGMGQWYAFAALAIFAVLGAYLISASRAATGVTAAKDDVPNIKYANTHERQVLDLHLPDRTGTAVPLVIDIHGGAFSGGDKNDEEYNFDQILAQGWAVASLNYRYNNVQFPAGAQDVKAAIRYLRAHATEYGIDPDKFAVWGRSAGGYMAVMAGTTGDQATVFDDDSLGNASVSDAVQAVVAYYPPTNFLTMDKHAREVCSEGEYQVHDNGGSPESVWLKAPVQESPLAPKANLNSYVATNTKLPKFILYHGTHDCTVPPGQSQELADALKAVGKTASLHFIEGAGHAQDNVFIPKVGEAIQEIKAAFDAVSTTPNPNPNPNPSPNPTTCPSLSTNYGSAQATIHLEQTGTYRIWSRILAPDTTNDSYIIEVDGDTCNVIVGDSGSAQANTWTWVDYRGNSTANKLDLPLATGDHTIRLIGREPGVAVDKLIFTMDTACVPQLATDTCGGTSTNPTPTGQPAITSFTATKTTINQGEDITLNWATTGATSCAITPDAGTVVPTGNWTSSVINMTGVQTYTLACSNTTGQQATKAVSVNVVAATVPDPVINSFTASPATIDSGGTSTLTWNTSNVAVAGCAVTPTPLSSTGTSGNWTTPSLTASQNYTLVCANGAGKTTSKSVSVVVKSSAPAPAPKPVTTKPSASTQNTRASVTTTTGSTVANSATSPTVSGQATIDTSNVTNTSKQREITRTEYYENGKLIHTDTEAPFTLDSTVLADGEHTITEKTYYNDGSTSELTNAITVANKTKEVAAMKSSSAAAWWSFILLILLAGGAGGFIYWLKRSRDSTSSYGYDASSYDTTAMGTPYYTETHSDGADWQNDFRNPNDRAS